jgi:hypothetical protein
MSLSFMGPRGSVEQRFIVYALLRDNVLHHLAPGAPAEAFPALRSISQALGGEPLRVPAQALHAELQAVLPLLARPIRDLAISGQTRALVDGVWPPASTGTSLVADAGVQLPSLKGKRTLDQVFGPLVRALLEITEGAPADSVLEVHDL